MVKGQNLVPNPSFEDTIHCPSVFGQITANNWLVVREDAEYYNQCTTNPNLSIPNNYFGFQWPHSGVAYIGIADYASDQPNIREAIGSYLTTPLTIGQKYFVSFFACPANRPLWDYSSAATNKLGMLFSTFAYSITNPPPIHNFSQIYATNIISDTTNWTIIRGSFIADSAYSFISITNFYDNAHTDTIHLDSTHVYQSYIYIDDICVSTDSLYCEVWTGIPQQILKSNIIVYPNPTNKEITIENLPSDCKQIEIYNIVGKLIKSINVGRINTFKFDVSTFAEGIYSIIIREDYNIQIKKFIKTKN